MFLVRVGVSCSLEGWECHVPCKGGSVMFLVRVGVSCYL